MTSPGDPKAEYSRRLAARQQVLDQCGRRSRRLADARLGVFGLGLGVAAAAFGWGALSGWWLAPLGGLFLVLVVVHDAVIRAEARAQRRVSHYAAGLQRLEHRWMGTGRQEDLAAPHHPYAADLDLFGTGSLFELLCTARTRSGEEALARWLLEPAPLATVLARQGGGQELRPRLDLREDLSVLGQDVRVSVHPSILVTWGEAPAIFTGAGLRWLLLAMALLAAATAVGWAALGLGPVPFLLAVLLGWGVQRSQKRRLERVMAALEQPSRELPVLAAVLARLEREPCTAPYLRQLQGQLSDAGVCASRCIARLGQLVDLFDAQRNQVFAPIAFILLWGPQVAMAVERWRLRHGPALRRWLQALGELEALAAVGGYGFEHPDDVLPELQPGPALLRGEALGHPLLPAATCVRNDVALGGPDSPQALVVSGSNMSGKSTLLRTVGINAVLAQAGAPVRARSLVLSPLSLGATLRIQDSLQEGSSRFYAEITRLRQIMELAAGERPLLFLLDEILAGTNSHDRRIGAAAVLQSLLGRGAIGFMTTHDLALTEVGERLQPRTMNVHFADELREGKLHFDYRMRPGVVQKSNALALMRAVGLDV